MRLSNGSAAVLRTSISLCSDNRLRRRNPPTQKRRACWTEWKSPLPNTQLPKHQNIKISDTRYQHTKTQKLQNTKISDQPKYKNILIRRPIWRRACWTEWPRISTFRLSNAPTHLASPRYQQIKALFNSNIKCLGLDQEELPPSRDGAAEATASH